MKFRLLLLMHLIICSNLYSQYYNLSDSTYYSDSSFTRLYVGDIVINYENGKIKSKMSYLDGKAHGEFISYYENGKINSKSNYVNNVEHGECLLYFEFGPDYNKINFLLLVSH